MLSFPLLSAPSVIAEVFIFFEDETEVSPIRPTLIVPSLHKDQLEFSLSVFEEL